MNNNYWTIWKELVKTNYQIKIIYVYIDINVNNIDNSSLELDIEFKNSNDLIKFKEGILLQFQLNIQETQSNDYFLIRLHKFDDKDNYKHNIDKMLLEYLSFPSNVDSIKIVCGHITYSEFQLNQNTDKIIKLHNLPENLYQLKISSSNPTVQFDISNLPLNLIKLDTSRYNKKLNLNYLPEGLKILYLPMKICNFDCNLNYMYNLSDLLNLPNSLTEINIGNIKKFQSTNELIKNFDKIFFTIK